MRRRKLIDLCLLFLSLFLLSACGKEEIYQPKVGIDGYVYTTQELLSVGQLSGDIKVAGDYVYYVERQEDGSGFEIKRLSLESINSDGTLKGKTRAKTVLRLTSGWKDMPDFIAEGLQKKLSSFEEEGGDITMWEVSDNGSLVDISKVRCSFSLLDFDVDMEGNFYCREDIQIRKNLTYESLGGSALSCIDSSGEKVYQIYYPDMFDFALCGDKGACILGDGRIILVDQDGVQVREISTEQYRGDGEPISERLLKDAEGHIYYALYNRSGNKWGFEVLTDEGLQLQETGEDICEAIGSLVCASSGRKLLSGSPYYDTLYEYDAEDGSEKEVLNWLDSGILSQYIQSIAQIAPGKLLVYYDNYPIQKLYLLTRIPVEELPERETVVLFSYNPSNDLKQAVLQFNRDNNAYRVIIDDFGARYSPETKEREMPKLDLAVVSQTPPDMMDMTYLDVYKYAGKGLLEDLMPYLEESSILNREDFLENALEGMTIDGCLTCIPNGFMMEWLLGRKNRLGEIERWSMEEVYGLSKKYPESAHRMIGDTQGNIEKREYLLNTFCAYYCLEEFIDWETGKCRFDSEEFSRLLKWVQEYAEDNFGTDDLRSDFPYIAEDVLLVKGYWVNFLEMADMEVRCGGEVVLAGFPSADGKGVYPVSMLDALAVTTNSVHKEGAWAFIEYFLSTSKPQYFSSYSTKRELLRKDAEEAIRQEYYPEGTVSMDGSTDLRRYKSWAFVEGEWVPYYAPPREQVDTILEAMESADFTPRSDKEKMVLRIISEEAESYYNGDKNIEEVIRIIQNRVSLLVQEG